MKRLGIEINGAGLIVAQAERVLVEEPGYAIIDDDGIVTGAAAYAQARLKPTRMRSGFWSGLTVEGSSAESNGELAFEHLRHVWQRAGHEDASAVLVVPGSFDAQQLGLVLGIAQECGIEVEALVDAGVAASRLRYAGRELLYVDATLRTVTVTRIDQSDDAAVDRFETSDATGLAAFADEMAKAIARIFVLDTRFDPLHDAGTEQALYDGLPVWLEALHADGKVIAELEYAGEKLTTELTTERVRSASLRLYREIARLIGNLSTPGVITTVQLNHRLAELPGLCMELGRIAEVELVELERGAPARFALQRVPHRHGGSTEVPLLRRLPFVGEAEAAAQQAAAPEPPVRRPTHVVYSGIGYRLDRGRIEISGSQASNAGNGTRRIAIGGSASEMTYCVFENGDGGVRIVSAANEALFVNDEAVAGQRVVVVGDVIRIGATGESLHIVAVES